MAIKDILVHLSDGDDCVARVDSAIALAQAHDAHLTGLYPVFIPTLPGYVQAQVGADILDHQHELFMEQARGAQARFDEAAKNAGISYESRCPEGRNEQLLCQHARYCDLLIMGKHEARTVDETTSLVEAAILGSGKPVLVLPDAAGAARPGRHVAIAWNASREAARAVDAAMPLLVDAERVDVLEVDPLQHGGEHLPAAEISTHLARHGVKVHAEGLSSKGSGIGQALLSRAVSDGADLLVMGAYGHARWRELILGGATAYVLRHSSMALLMAH